MVNISIWEKRLEKAISELKTETRPSKVKILQERIQNFKEKVKNIAAMQSTSDVSDTDKNPDALKINHLQDRSKYKCSQKYNFNDQEIVSALKESIKHFYKSGSRSSAKLIPLHSFINCAVNYKLQLLLPELYKDISIFSHPVKEIKVSGLIYNKDIDVTVKYKSRNVGIISVKFIMSNYSQNNVNYIESMIGECVNIKTNKNNRIFWHPIFIFNKIPYYDSRNEIKKTETLHLNKYQKLMKYINNHRDSYNVLPDYISITILNNALDLLHPNKVDNTNIDNYINELLDNKNQIIDIGKEFSFVENLNMFCEKVADNILQKASSDSPYSNYSSSSKSASPKS
jgi:hypothetical protein